MKDHTHLLVARDASGSPTAFAWVGPKDNLRDLAKTLLEWADTNPDRTVAIESRDVFDELRGQTKGALIAQEHAND